MSEPTPSLNDLRIERKPDSESHSRFWLIACAVLLLGAGAAFGVWRFKQPGAFEVKTAAVRQTSTNSAERTVLNASGYVTPRREATVSSKVTGKVIEVLIEEGMKVQEGQVLARIDDTNIRASLRLAEAQLSSSKAALEETQVRATEAEQELQRQAGLLTNNIASQADYDHAQAAALAYKARLAQQALEVIVAERSLATWTQQLEDAVIRAPFSGIVTSKNAQPGEMISPISAGGGFTRTGICTIVDMQSLEIEIDVNESYINRVQSGQAVEGALDAYPEWKIPCKVIAIIPTADRQKSTVKVRVGFDSLDPRILPEMSVKVAFRETATTSPATARLAAVPKQAVRQQDGRDIVWVVLNERVERRAVTVHSTDLDQALLSAGVSAGEKVVVDGPPGLVEGAKIVEKPYE
jgi:HlyD family secretion protein